MGKGGVLDADKLISEEQHRAAAGEIAEAASTCPQDRKGQKDRGKKQGRGLLTCTAILARLLTQGEARERTQKTP